MPTLRVVIADDFIEQKIEPLIIALCNWLDRPASAAAAASTDLHQRVNHRVHAIRQFLDLQWSADYSEAQRLLSTPDLAVGIIDLRWGKEDIGPQLVALARQKHPRASLFQYTAYFREISDIVDQTNTNYGAPAFESADVFVSRVLPVALQNAAKQVIAHMDALDRRELLNLCSRHDSIEAFIELRVAGWRIGDLAVGWHGRTQSDPAYPDDLPQKIRETVWPDLSLAASWYYGVGPIKQITHSPQGYFRGSKQDFQEQVEQRKSGLDAALTCAHAVVSTATENVRKVQCIADHFHHSWKTGWAAAGDSYPYFVAGLGDARNAVRCGTAINSGTRLCACTSACCHTRKGEHFEVYVPIREMFGKDIDEVVSSGGGGSDKFMLAACGKPSVQSDRAADTTKQPYVVLNYQIFPLCCKQDQSWSKRTIENWASSADNLLAKGFSLFGKIFMIIKANNGVEIYDITLGSRQVNMIQAREFLPEFPCRCQSEGDAECEVSKHTLAKVSENSPILVLRLETWRQPQ